MIGIVGGVGPLAGLDVFKKIIEETAAQQDQDHLPVLLMSYPQLIVDRTAYLLGKTKTNPAYALANILKNLAENGAKVAAIPCNTAHAQPIFSVIQQLLENEKVEIKLLNLVEETVNFIKSVSANASVAVLSTTGTKNTGLYKDKLLDLGLEVIQPNEEWQERVHQAIYSKDYGIKAYSSPVKEKAINELKACMDVLMKQKPNYFILGCTELPLALPESKYRNVPLIDPNRVIARSLVRFVDESKLKRI